MCQRRTQGSWLKHNLTAANTLRKTLGTFIEKIDNNYLGIRDEKIQNARRKIKENEWICDTEVSRLCESRDKIAEIIDKLRKEKETGMIGNLKKKKIRNKER